MEIKIDNLFKKYKDVNVLKGINLEIKNGMFGLLGPNGAGKTTLIRILTTLIPQTSGKVEINGIDVRQKKEVRKIIGYLPQEFSFYPEMTVTECMDYLAILSGIKNRKNRIEKVKELLEKVNLLEQKDKRCKSLSGGMKRRLGIAQAMLNNPKVLIVDEPTAGLDPEERIRLRNLLSDFSKNKIVILSTHIVEDIEYTCENIAILNKGQIIYLGNVSSLIKKAEGKIWSIEFKNNKFEEVKKKYTLISSIYDKENVKVRILSEKKPMEEAVTVKPTMEDAYMQLIKG